MTVTPLLLAAMAASCVSILVLTLLRPAAPEPARRRMDRLRPTAEPVATIPLRTRVAQSPLWNALTRSRVLLPARLVGRAGVMLEHAGIAMSGTTFVLMWVAIVAAFAAVGLLSSSTTHELSSALRFVMLLLWVSGAAALPWAFVRRRGQRRTREIDAALPQAIDMIVTTIEAGLGLQAAMLTVARRLQGPIAVEFGRVMREIGIGRARDEALLAMADRSGSRDVAGLARAIAQAERSGISIASVLRTHAQEMRQRRRDLAREQANRIPVKITVLTILFIFPTLFLLVLGPVALNAMDYMRR
jgi:tight adherence protein C